MIITKVEVAENAQSLQGSAANDCSPEPKTSRRQISRLVWDGVWVFGCWVFVLVVSRNETFTWLYTPDSEFYASLSAFGREITDRAVVDAYYWTKLGVIGPQYALSRAFGFIAAHEIFRAVLLLLILVSSYVVARTRASRLISSLAALLVGLNTVILGFLGDTYATGVGLACLTVIFGLCYLWPLADGWQRVLISVSIGVNAGWLLMIHPNFVLVSAISSGVFMLGNLAFRRRVPVIEVLGNGVAVVAGFSASFATFLAIGTQIFPGMRWVDTVKFWSQQLNASAYASKNWDWLWSEGSLLVPLTCLGICLGIWLLTRRAEVGIYSAVCASAIIALVVFAATSGGPTLEASFFNACLWPSSLMASVAALTVNPVAQWSSNWWPVLAAIATVPAWVALGHWNRPSHMSVLVAVAVTAVLVVLALVSSSLRLTKRNPGLGVGLVVLAFAVAGSAAQLLQNGRPLTPVGVVMRQPYWNSYVQSPAEDVIRLDLGIQSWVLDSTAPTDRVAVWVQPQSNLYGPAGMSLWGPNAVSLGSELGEWERANLTYLNPTAVVLYGNDMPGINRMIVSLQTSARVSSTFCRDFTEAGPHPVFGTVGATQLFACIVRVSTGT